MSVRTLSKDVIKPGLYPTGNILHRVTKEGHIDRWNENFELLRQRGYHVPIWMNHPERGDENNTKGFPVKADRLKEFEKDPWYVGSIKSLSLAADGMLQFNFEDEDEKRADRLEAVGTFVSPQFGPWKDTEGNIYDSTLTHMALTPNPVNKDQSKQFVRTPETQIEDKLPTLQIQFSLDSWLPDSEKSSTDPVDRSPGDRGKSNQDSSPDGEPQDVPGMVRRITDILASRGFQVSVNSGEIDAGEASKILEALVSAGLGKEPDLTSKSGGELPAGVTTMQGQVAMSTDANKPDSKVDELTARMDKQAKDFENLQTQFSAQTSTIDRLTKENTDLRTRNFESVRSGLVSQIGTLVTEGRITKAKGEEWTKDINTVQFSDAGGHDAVIARYEDRVQNAREIPKYTHTTPEERREIERQSGPQAVGDPRGDTFFTNDGMTAEQEAAAVEAAVSGDFSKLK